MNIKSQFTVDFCPPLYTDKTTIKHIIYVKYMLHNFFCVTVYTCKLRNFRSVRKQHADAARAVWMDGVEFNAPLDTV